ncbi:MAG: hypothetical protein D6698_02000 [Gammaproteobacteria bacterium]|nr:MAG: hypothetical protein D6698_02000 [Gammaproteobacteria bacterium]
MKNSSLIRIALSLGAFLLLCIYFSINLGDARTALKKFNLFWSGNPSATLRLLTRDGNTLLETRLRLSDFFDGSGHRQLNFQYLSQRAFNNLAKHHSDIQIFLDHKKIASANMTSLNKKAIAITLPEKKIYLLAPPHLDMMIRALAYERKLRPDIFTCSSDKVFCQSIKLERFAGLSRIYEKTLEADRPEHSDLIPRGREAGRHVTLWFSAKKRQAVQIVIHMKTPIPEQSLRSSVPGEILQQEHVGFAKDYNLARLNELIYHFLKMNTLDYQLNVDAVPGVNRIDIEFSELSRIPVIFPIPIAGIITNINFQRPRQ